MAAPGTLAPAKLPGLRIVAQQLAQARAGQTRTSFHGGLANEKRAAKRPLRGSEVRIYLVPRTRSSHHNCRASDCELRVQSGTRIIDLLVSQFRSSLRSVRQTQGELRNRDTRDRSSAGGTAGRTAGASAGATRAACISEVRKLRTSRQKGCVSLAQARRYLVALAGQFRAFTRCGAAAPPGLTRA